MHCTQSSTVDGMHSQGMKAFTLSPEALRQAVPNLCKLTLQIGSINDDVRVPGQVPQNDIDNAGIMLSAWAETLLSVTIDFRGLSPMGMYHRPRYIDRGLASFPALRRLRVVRMLRLEGVDLAGCEAVLQLPSLRVVWLRFCHVPHNVLLGLSTSLDRFSASYMY